jgi:hypothetical protein
MIKILNNIKYLCGCAALIFMIIYNNIIKIFFF